MQRAQNMAYEHAQVPGSSPSRGAVAIVHQDIMVFGHAGFHSLLDQTLSPSEATYHGQFIYTESLR